MNRLKQKDVVKQDLKNILDEKKNASAATATCVSLE